MVGMPGCGKSTVGKALAKHLRYRFLDLDTRLEEQENLSVAQVFEQYGQAYFREAEAKALRQVTAEPGSGGIVLATGGGAPCFHGNMDFMKQKGVVVYLQVTVAALVARLTASDLAVRPLLRGKSEPELRDYLSEVLAQREGFYAQAQVAVETDGQDAKALAKALLDRLRKFSAVGR